MSKVKTELHVLRKTTEFESPRETENSNDKKRDMGDSIVSKDRRQMDIRDQHD